MDSWATGCCRGACSSPRPSGSLAVDGYRRRERVEDLQPLDRIVELQTGLLVGERNRQYLGEAVADPRRIVQPHLEPFVDLAELRQHGFQQQRQPCKMLR